MYPFDTKKHNEPHFHVMLSNGRRASVAISDGRVLEGMLTRRQRELVYAWLLIHKEEVWDRWNKAVAGEYISKIEPKQI